MMSVLAEIWPTLAIGLLVILFGVTTRQRTPILLGVIITLERIVPPLLGSYREAGVLGTPGYRLALDGLYVLLGVILLIEGMKSYRDYVRSHSRQR